MLGHLVRVSETTGLSNRIQVGLPVCIAHINDSRNSPMTSLLFHINMVTRQVAVHQNMGSIQIRIHLSRTNKCTQF